ncbi:uncharacterized protein LOC144722619 isoform X2 [Lampetra planeri]
MRPLASSIALLLVLTTHASRTAGAKCGTDTIRMAEGGEAECNCTGIDVASLIWIPDNAECDEHGDPGDSSRWNLQLDGGGCWLIIKNVRMSDRGMIILQPEGRQVKLFIEPVCTALHIQSATDNTTDEVRLTCRSGGKVAPEEGIEWTYQGQRQASEGNTVVTSLQRQGLWSCTYEGQTAGFCLVESRISEIKEAECESKELTSLTPQATQASDHLSPPIIEIALAVAGCILVVVAVLAGVYFYRESKKALISPYVSEPADNLRQSRMTCHPDYSYNNGDCGHSVEMPYVPMTKQRTSQIDGETEEHYDYENVSDTLNVQDEGTAQPSSLHQQNPLYLCNDTLYGDVA